MPAISDQVSVKINPPKSTVGDIEMKISGFGGTTREENKGTGGSSTSEYKMETVGLPIAAMDGWSKGMDELLGSAIYELGGKGTEAPIDVINNHLHNSYMMGAGLYLKGAFKDWQGKDGSQMQVAGTEMMKTVSTKYTSFVGNVMNMNSDNKDVREAARAGLNTFVGDPEKLKNIVATNNMFATYMQGLLGRVQAQASMFSILNPMQGQYGYTSDSDANLQSMAAALASVADLPKGIGNQEQKEAVVNTLMGSMSKEASARQAAELAANQSR